MLSIFLVQIFVQFNFSSFNSKWWFTNYVTHIFMVSVTNIMFLSSPILPPPYSTVKHHFMDMNIISFFPTSVLCKWLICWARFWNFDWTRNRSKNSPTNWNWPPERTAMKSPGDLKKKLWSAFVPAHLHNSHLWRT